jgi:ParB-like chromosome segregation protein Spo0J
MEVHEYADAFPLATESELAEMAADIRQRGLLCPIITLDGKVLDGRNRLRACEIAGVAPRFQEYTGTDPLADVVSWNLKRRHLTPSQQAGIGADVANMRQGERTDLEPSANLPKVSQSEAAKMVGVSERLVRDAVKVKKAAPELHEEVKAGRMTVNAAKREAKQREAESDERKGNEAGKKAPARQRGSFTDWQKLRDLFEIVRDAVNQMNVIRVDSQHRIQARSMCEAMSERFDKLAQKLVE